jgi:hypothetical protein
MATSRRKPSSFIPPQKEETPAVEETLVESAAEMFETFLQTEKEPDEKVEIVTSPPKDYETLPEIIPTEDAGPRFVDPPAPPTPRPQEPTPQLQPPPKRHPRNIPKFSRHK